MCSFFADRHTIVDGNIEETLADAEVVVEGELKVRLICLAVHVYESRSRRTPSGGGLQTSPNATRRGVLLAIIDCWWS